MQWFAKSCARSRRELQNNPQDLLKPLDTINIWDRYVVGPDNPESARVADRFIVLRHVALFKRFGYGEPVAEEGKAIASLIQKGFPQITWPRFQEVIAELKTRRILQGETTLYLSPKLLHIKLWADWWEIHGQGFQFDEFAADLKGTLLPWFLEMFKYAEQSRAAQNLVTHP